MSTIFKCPRCGKGKLNHGGIGYVCDYFKSIDDKCGFVIYSEMFGHAMTDDDVAALCAGEITERYTLTRRDGTEFTAALKYDPVQQAVAPSFEDVYLEHVACRCGGRVKSGAKYFACENSSKEDPSHVFFNRVIAGVEVDDETAVALLKGQRTGFIDGFVGKDGEFTAKLYMDGYDVKFDSVVCSCPACGGNVKIGKKTYYCSNFKREGSPCDFHIFKEMSGKSITPSTAATLCKQGETSILEGFKKKDGTPIARKIVLNDEYKVLLA
jgi:hypothetical protein